MEKCEEDLEPFKAYYESFNFILSTSLHISLIQLASLRIHSGFTLRSPTLRPTSAQKEL